MNAPRRGERDDVTQTTARQEWAAGWPLPFLGMIGIAGSTIFPFASGLLMEPMTAAYGWSRSEYSFAFLLQVIVGFFFAPLAGRLIDKYGARAVILRGIPVTVAGFLLVGLVGQPVWQWWALVVLLGITCAPILPTGWMAAVISRFEVTRGIALAIALAGVGLGTAIWPVLAALLLEYVGWRPVLPLLGLGWGLVVLPLAFFFLHQKRAEPADVASAERPAPPPKVGEVVRSPAFILITAAGGIFIGTLYGFNLHLVPILKGLGYTNTSAAGIAGLAGIMAIVGRVVTGFLLDRLPTKPIGLVIFLIPICSALMLWSAEAVGIVPLAAVILLGLSIGAETDIIAYVASRQFDQRIFSSAYAIVTSVFSLCAGAGPLLASSLYDRAQSYDLFFPVACGLIGIGAVCLALVPMRAAPGGH